MPIESVIEDVMQQWRPMLAVGYEVAKHKTYTFDEPYKLPVDESLLGLERFSKEDRAKVVDAINRGFEAAGFANSDPAMGQEMARMDRPRPVGKLRRGFVIDPTMRIITTDISGVYDKWELITDEAIHAAHDIDMARAGPSRK